MGEVEGGEERNSFMMGREMVGETEERAGFLYLALLVLERRGDDTRSEQRGGGGELFGGAESERDILLVDVVCSAPLINTRGGGEQRGL
jgi:hypothetical protein